MPLFVIDTPAPFRSHTQELILTGWIAGQTTPTNVRARIGSVIFESTSGLERPDVLSTYPEADWSRRCGFTVLLRADHGTHPFVLELKGPDDGWTTFFQAKVEFRRPELRFNLESPKLTKLFVGSTQFSGWCFHSELPIRKLEVHFNDTKVIAHHGHHRADVLQIHPDGCNADQSGFDLTADLEPGRHNIHLVAQLEDGTVVRSKRVRSILVRQQTLGRPGVLATIQSSKAFKPIRFSRYAYTRFQQWYSFNKRLPRYQEIRRLSQRALREFRSLHHDTSPSFYKPPPWQDIYQTWIKNNRLTKAETAQLQAEITSLGTCLAKISIVMPVYNPPLEYFEQAIASVRAQTNKHWQLCLADDASTDDWIWPRLQQLALEDDRVSIVRRPINGNISLATNSAAALATGEFLLFFDQDDLLTTDAIARLALAAGQNTNADIIYTDDDKITADGERFAPQFKPDWSPELLLSYMYISHAFCVRRTLFQDLGGFRVGFEGSQDYDFALRATQQAREVFHIPRVLYHWRAIPGSTAQSGNAKPLSFEAGKQAVQQALQRMGAPAVTVNRPVWAQKAGVGIFTHQFGNDGPEVAILIPTKNNPKILKRCLDSLQSISYVNHKIVIIDNDSDDIATVKYLQSLPYQVLQISNPTDSFNYAYINNKSIEQVKAQYILLLNDDTEALNPDWLSQMMGYAQIPGVGAVGARLLYPNNQVQHAGIIHGLYGGLVGPAFKLNAPEDFGYLSYAAVLRNYGAITAACLLTKRDLFLSLGGFDEDAFAVAYNDVDLCYRLIDSGYRCVYVPSAELIHHEGTSRGFTDSPREVLAFKQRYGKRYDPYYSPNLSLDNEQFLIKTNRAKTKGLVGQPRVLMCSHTLNLEGAPYFLLNLAIELKEQGLVEPIIFSPCDGPLRQIYAQHGIFVQINQKQLGSLKDSEQFDQVVDDFGEWITNSGSTLVLANTLESFYAIAAAKRFRLPSLWIVHESQPWQTYYADYPEDIASKALDCFSHAYSVIFVAHATRRRFTELNRQNNFRVIHNAIKLTKVNAEAAQESRNQSRQTLDVTSDEVVVLLVGTVCDRKGQIDLVRAMLSLDPVAGKRIRCFIVGDRPSAYSDHLHREIRSLPSRYASKITVVKECKNTALYYSAADIFLCTSRFESYPLVILEAMAHELPIITTACFGVVEQVKPGVNASYYEAGETKQLAECLNDLIVDESKRKRFASNSPIVLASLVTFNEMVAEYAELMSEALDATTAHLEHLNQSAPLAESFNNTMRRSNSC